MARIALNNLDQAGNDLGTDFGIGIGITWEAYLRWETRGFRARNEPRLSRPSCKKGITLLSLISTQLHE